MGYYSIKKIALIKRSRLKSDFVVIPDAHTSEVVASPLRLKGREFSRKLIVKFHTPKKQSSLKIATALCWKIIPCMTHVCCIKKRLLIFISENKIFIEYDRAIKRCPRFAKHFSHKLY